MTTEHLHPCLRSVYEDILGVGGGQPRSSEGEGSIQNGGQLRELAWRGRLIAKLDVGLTNPRRRELRQLL